jgi:N,N'-diacetyllegionaminate synthase
MNRTLIIAEAGVNHNGSLVLAKQLIDVAAKSGADYVKFQTFKTENIVSKVAKKAEYQIKNFQKDSDTQFGMLKKLELSFDDHLELVKYCYQKNIKFLSTAFDLDSIDMVYELGVRLFKIPSGEITNLPYLQKIAGLGEKLIISTGMCNMEDIRNAINVFLNAGKKLEDIVVLHCNTEYPTPMQDVNLKAMHSIASEFKVKIGYSDHTKGIEVPVAAVAMGAVVIEKHFTLDKLMDGPDHLASLEPQELEDMVKAIRNIEMAIGDGVKAPSNSEKKNMSIARKSIHLKKDKLKGDTINSEDLLMLRPGDGISPMKMDLIIGKKLNADLPEFHKLTEADYQ